MKSLYWRPQRLSLRVLLLVVLAAFCGFLAVEAFQVEARQPYYEQKRRAAQLALEAFRVVREARLQRKIPIDPAVDPANSGLVGELISPITTNTGHLPSKQTSLNPNFAAVALDMLQRAGVRKGDNVAVGLSGSFPALNICVLAAVVALEAKPLVISSVGASQFGANNPSFTWLDMEQELARNGVLQVHSLAAFPGGIEDRALGLSKRGRQLLQAAQKRSGALIVEPNSYLESLERRMEIYQEAAGATEVRAYINVGGAATSVGTRVGKLQFKPGLNRSAGRSDLVDSVMSRYAKRGIPVIHFTQIDALAQQYALPVQPSRIPPIGASTVFIRKGHNRWLAGGVLAALLVMLTALLRLDLGHRLLERQRTPAGTSEHPEPMV